MKTLSATQKDEPLGHCVSVLTSSPRKKKTKRKFKGKLSHTSSVSPNNMITKYYHSKPNSLNAQENSPVKNILQDSNALDDLKRKVLQETNFRLEDSRLNIISGINESECYKTETCVPLSPSTALSQLNLNSPRKISKIRKQLAFSAARILNDNYSDNKQTRLTEFFPVRRSIRKTKKTVLEEKRKTIEEAILSNKEDGLEVRIFEGKGRGIVAARKFEKGEFVVEYAGELISMEEAQKREAVYSQDENIGCYMYYFKHKNSQHCIDATAETGRLGRLLNHSRNGNLCTKTIEVEGIPRLILLAKDNIEPGSELTYDYGDRSKLSLQHHP